MLEMDFKKLVETGVIQDKFHMKNHGVKYEDNEATYRVNLYVTGITACPCRCKFCRNIEMGSIRTQFNEASFNEMYEKYGGFIRMITFGGGEPLLYLDKILEMIQNREIGYSGRAFITSGIKDEFLKYAHLYRKDHSARGYSYENVLELDSAFDVIYLSRHCADNKKNQESFGTPVPLLEREDIRALPAGIVDKMVVTTTCYKNGGTYTVKEMHRMIQWTKNCTIPSIIFNDLQKSMTDAKFYEENQVDDTLFERCIERLKELSDDFHFKHEIVFSGGYTVTTYSSEKLRLKVGFKKYHKNKEETIKAWKSAKKRTFDLTMEPDGSVYLDQL